MKNLKQRSKDVKVLLKSDQNAKLALVLEECLGTLAVGNSLISLGLWESAYRQADLAKTALNIANRPFADSAKLSTETAQLLCLVQRDLGALEAGLKILPTI